MLLLEMLKAKNKLHLVKATDKDVKQAKRLSLHYHDPLHALVAKKAGATFVVTRDLKGFQCCKHILEAYLPEEI
jgi:predicted nucleic acid-binding protein